MEQVTYNGEGKHDVRAKGRQKFKLKTFESFVVEWKEKNKKVWNIVGPHDSTIRTYEVILNNGEMLQITTEGKWTIQMIDLPLRGERSDGESLVEIIPEGEMNMYDKLRQEMLQMFQQKAVEAGYETLEEADDLEFEEDDENLIDTPYEYKAMVDEYIAQRPQDEPYTDEFENKLEEKEVEQKKEEEKQEIGAT